jgi:hypothetical protein
MIAIFSILPPAASAIARVKLNCARPITEAVAVTLKTLSKPRPVISSAYAWVRNGISARAVTSDITSVNDDAYAPRTAVSSFCVIRRWATVEAVVGFEVASLTTRLILAPPSALMPPAALIVSATNSMPLRQLMPN